MSENTYHEMIMNLRQSVELSGKRKHADPLPFLASENIN